MRIRTHQRICRAIFLLAASGALSLSMAEPIVRDHRQPIVRDHRHGPANTLDILTYNVQLLPLVKDLHQYKRAGLIADSPVMNHIDVVVFQEAFADAPRTKLLERLESRFPYQTRVLGTDTTVAGVTVKQDGGVVILSSYPIENCPRNARLTVKPGERGVPRTACGGFNVGLSGAVVPVWPGEQRLFGGKCAGDLATQAVREVDKAAGVEYSGVGTDLDCLAKKGVLYARINKKGRLYHVFGTHLDSRRERQDVAARKQQLKVIATFIEDLEIPSNEPVIIAGDFNIGALGDSGGGDPARDLYAAGLPLRGNSGATHINGQQLDHIFYSKAHLQPLRDQSFREVRVALGGPPGEPFHGNLSDHHALAARLVFPQMVATVVPLGR